jgi:hypothetical protein
MCDEKLKKKVSSEDDSFVAHLLLSDDPMMLFKGFSSFKWELVIVIN